MSSKTGTVLSIIIFNCKNDKTATVAASVMDLSSFSMFNRGSAKEIATFSSREVVARTAVGQKLCIRNDKLEMDFICHTYVNSQKVGGAVITMGPYPQRVAFALLSKAMDLATLQHGDKLLSSTKDINLDVTGMADLLSKYQKPDSADPIMKIDKDLRETKDIMMLNIEKILERGEKIEDLVDRTNELSTSSKLFVKQAEKLNRCCVII